MDKPIASVRLKRTEKVVAKVQNMSLSNIRQIMGLFTKRPELTPDHFLPSHGITVGEFCVAYVVKSTMAKT